MIFQNPLASLYPRWRVARIIGEQMKSSAPIQIPPSGAKRSTACWNSSIWPLSTATIPARLFGRTAAAHINRARRVDEAGSVE
ncbi:hypothetical protein [Pararhodobacter sp. SW119]|uniref:hypothetical protein n=1 Tax=Pararhodobacter sp. SW119 TaxID=2780075 RepID=UPI001ADFE9CE|nr:hypothetical protein [Pararhodobacter sp. SW119]